ncbi:MAG: hypothetical protein M3Q23_03380 [Actinomycetota bacterium]|nr:hypothetical protein [Actinomycetota bacterium]
MPESRSRAGDRSSRAGDRSEPSGRTGGSRRSGGATPEMPPPRPAVCPVGFCPVGMALTFAEGVRPEAVEHLMRAGAELLMAVKAVVDARVEGLGRESPLERITIE